MSITHKVLVRKDTGKQVERVHTIDDPRPCPPDCIWIPLVPGTPFHKLFVTNEDVSHLNMEETYWDPVKNKWIEVVSVPVINEVMVRYSRDERLRDSDFIIATAKTAEEVAAWATYRQQLRDMFHDLHVHTEHSAKFTGYINGTTLTVVSVKEGLLKRAMHIEGDGVASNTYITLHGDHLPTLTGTGQTGTYEIAPSQTLGSANSPVALEGFDHSTLILPRTPLDIQVLKEKAAAGDEEAAAIVLRDNL
jgi:hypothetical protein